MQSVFTKTWGDSYTSLLPEERLGRWRGEMKEVWREGLMEKDLVCYRWRETVGYVIHFLNQSLGR